MRVPRFLPLVLAAPFLAVALLFVAGKRQEVADFVAAKGKVTELSSASCGSSGRHTCWRPVIAYSLDGKTVHILRSTDKLNTKPEIGSELELLVNPGNPDDARIDSYDGHWGSSVVTASIAGLFFLFALAYGVIPRKYMIADYR